MNSPDRVVDILGASEASDLSSSLSRGAVYFMFVILLILYFFVFYFVLFVFNLTFSKGCSDFFRLVYNL